MKKFYLLIITLLLVPLLLFGGYRYKLSIASVFQNEADYLKEWIEFHRIVGVEHFYLYNNESSDHYMEVLKPYVDKGIVELIQWPNLWPDRLFFEGCQIFAYEDALSRARKESKWLALIDTDEFIFPTQGGSLLKYLDRNYDKFSGVAINWQCYGTSNVILQPGELMLEKLVLKAPENEFKNTWYKMIVKPKDVTQCASVHFCLFKQGKYAVDTHKDPSIHSHRFIYTDCLRINHYWFRDYHFLHNIKMPRYRVWGWPAEALPLTDEMFSVVEDKSIYIFLPQLKKQMGL